MWIVIEAICAFSEKYFRAEPKISPSASLQLYSRAVKGSPLSVEKTENRAPFNGIGGVENVVTMTFPPLPAAPCHRECSKQCVAAL